jgi:hypothetical protein
MNETELKEMEEYIEELCSVQLPKMKTTLNDQADSVEKGMKVPVSVPEACNDSFTAADEKWQKASTKRFADTGLMALLCRHDRVLFIANMTSAGEWQYYVFALFNKLFLHLPLTTTVGLLYDVACTTERSCLKWGFLEEYIPWLTFTISVFHAYGHKWPCQVVYHP